MSVIEEIAAERERQKTVEGWSADHDDTHRRGELARAAASYAMPKPYQDLMFDNGEHVLGRLWPWDWNWWKPRDRRRNLIKAGALIVAEIERLDREHCPWCGKAHAPGKCERLISGGQSE